MIDIHNHIIFRFDDGPKTLNESLDMLRMAADQGITDVFATSHFNEMIPQETEEDYFNKLALLREEVDKKNIAIKLHSGSEMFYHHFMDKTVASSRVTTLADQNQYILMEFPMFLMPTGVEDTVFKLTMDDYIPIIAHPERYSVIIEKPEKIVLFIRYGGLLQVNAGSIVGDFGRRVQKIALNLLEKQLVHFVASDAHSTKGRSFKLDKAISVMEENLDKEYVKQLTQTNPAAILSRERLKNVALPQLELEDESGGFLSRVKRRFKLS
ncbi:MAG: tyrosine-protein phosphatase [Calditrichia bacterium]